MPEADLPDPPGGKLICPPGYNAWVTTDEKTGETTAECEPGPLPSNNTAYGNWVFNKAFNLKREQDKILTDVEQAILESGVLVAQGRIIRFTSTSEDNSVIGV